MKALGDLAIGPILDEAQNEQCALGFREVGHCSKDGGWERQAVVDGLEVGVHDCDREAQTLPSAGLDPALAQGRPKYIVGDAIEPRKCGTVVLVAEPLSAAPGQREDFGRQIGAKVTDPDRRPRENLSHVPVIDLGKGVGIIEHQQLGVRLL